MRVIIDTPHDITELIRRGYLSDLTNKIRIAASNGVDAINVKNWKGDIIYTIEIDRGSTDVLYDDYDLSEFDGDSE